MKQIEKISITPDPYEPYYISQGLAVGELLFISGQTAVDETGEIVAIGNFEQQLDTTFKNLEKILIAGESDLAHVVKVTIFLTDMTYFDSVVAYRKKYFTEPYPADTIVEVNSLFDVNVLVEIEAIAVKKSKLIFS